MDHCFPFQKACSHEKPQTRTKRGSALQFGALLPNPHFASRAVNETVIQERPGYRGHHVEGRKLEELLVVEQNEDFQTILQA